MHMHSADLDDALSATSHARPGRVLSTGLAALDRLLGGGWPRGRLAELHTAGAQGTGPGLAVVAAGVRLALGHGQGVVLAGVPALPARLVGEEHLVRLPHASPERTLVDLAVRLMSLPGCALVAVWTDGWNAVHLHRLGMLAASHHAAVVAVRREAVGQEAPASPAGTRLRLTPQFGGVAVEGLRGAGNGKRTYCRLYDGPARPAGSPLPLAGAGRPVPDAPVSETPVPAPGAEAGRSTLTPAPIGAAVTVTPAASAATEGARSGPAASAVRFDAPAVMPRRVLAAARANTRGW